VAYLLIERRLHKSNWGNLGFKFQTFWADLRSNWFWSVLVGLVSQTATALLAKAFLLAYLEHIRARLLFGDGIGWAKKVGELHERLVNGKEQKQSLQQRIICASTGQ